MQETFRRLRDDAKERGMDDLVIAYGWTLIRLNQDDFDQKYAQQLATYKKMAGYG